MKVWLLIILILFLTAALSITLVEHFKEKNE